MTIRELLKQLTENLTDEQKDMPARFADSDGTYYEIDSMFVVSVSSTKTLPEGQVILACFGTDETE